MLHLGIILAVLSGLSGNLSGIAISLPAHYAKVSGRSISQPMHFLSVAVSLSLTGVAVLLNIAACSREPVAIVFPLAVATSLTSNMILQGLLGLSKYSNVAIVGTLIMVVAVLLLPDIGPLDNSSDSEEEAVVLMTQAKAIVFIASCLVLNVLCLTAIRCKMVTKNLALIFMFAVVGGTSVVLNTSIQKMLSMDLPAMCKACLGLVWVVLSGVALGSGALANGTLSDPSLFVPISNGINLVLNCLAGLCIWGDGSRLAFPVSYALVYVIVVLGTYLVSSVDVFSMVHLHIKARVYSHSAGTVIGGTSGLLRPGQLLLKSRSMLSLLTRSASATESLLEDTSLDDWPHLKAGITLLRARSVEDFEAQLRMELQANMITPAEAAALCARLLERAGGMDEGRECVQGWVSTISS